MKAGRVFEEILTTELARVVNSLGTKHNDVKIEQVLLPLARLMYDKLILLPAKQPKIVVAARDVTCFGGRALTNTPS